MKFGYAVGVVIGLPMNYKTEKSIIIRKTVDRTVKTVYIYFIKIAQN